MSRWNHRVLRRTVNGETFFQIHEVHYDDEGNPVSHTVEPVAPSGGTLEELRVEITRFLIALDAPVLPYIEVEMSDELKDLLARTRPDEEVLKSMGVDDESV